MVGSNYLLGFSVAVFFATASLCANPARASESGYLPSVGPASLRYSVPTKPFRSAVISPKTVEVTDDSAEEKDPIPLPIAKSETIPSQPSVAEMPIVPAQTNTLVEPSAPNSTSEPSPDLILSPQMFLKFFDRSSAIVAIPVAPVEFKSPTPATPSSKATYSISP